MTKKRKIAVIGSNSFSGGDFIDLLLENNRNHIIGISRSEEKSSIFLPYKQHKSKNFRFYQMDLNNDTQKIINLLDTFKPEYIINFAAQSEVAPSWEHPEQWFQTNIVALAKLVNVLKDRSYLKRYIHISSPEVYGTCNGKITESSPLNPSTPYAVSKAAADMFLTTMFKNFNFPLITIRSTNVYGAHQQLFKIIPKSIINIKLKTQTELHGGGNAIKSYIHIRDISRGELAVMETGRVGEIYHLSPEYGISIKDIVKIICNKMQVDFEDATKIVDERLGQDAAYVIDSSKSKNEFNWEPKISINEGITETINWIETNWNTIIKESMKYIHKE